MRPVEMCVRTIMNANNTPIVCTRGAGVVSITAVTIAVKRVGRNSDSWNNTWRSFVRTIATLRHF
jgi:hypothetical protein